MPGLQSCLVCNHAWFAIMPGLLSCLVCYHAWFAIMPGLLSCLVCYHAWFAIMPGLLSCLVCYHAWFAIMPGLLSCLVCYHAWFAIMPGLLSCLVCYHAWFAIMPGLLSCLVCYHAWFAIMSLGCWLCPSELWSVNMALHPSKPGVVALCYYTTPGRSPPQSWGVSVVKLYNYSNCVCHSIAPAVGIAHIPTPICRWIHDWWESQFIDPFRSETLHVTLTVCA